MNWMWSKRVLERFANGCGNVLGESPFRCLAGGWLNDTSSQSVPGGINSCQRYRRNSKREA